MSIETGNLAEAIKEIAEMANRGREVDTFTASDGKTYLFKSDKEGNPSYMELPVDKVFKPETMKVNTLTSFVNYIKAGISLEEIKEALYINITSPTRAVAQTAVNKYGERFTIAVAERYDFCGFRFGISYDYESFIVAVRSKFEATDELKSLLGVLKSVTKSNEISSEDNGITQIVTAKNGVALGSLSVNPVWSLKPYRTFTEVEQPSSLFLLRLSSRSEATDYTLHETDGGAWAVEAMREIGKYLFNAFEEEIAAGKIFVL